MLVLDRKMNESIVVDGNIRIKVVRIGRGRVTIGIEAPGHVGIYREELLEGLVREFCQARGGALNE
jgi:carbon storage regulator